MDENREIRPNYDDDTAEGRIIFPDWHDGVSAPSQTNSVRPPVAADVAPPGLAIAAQTLTFGAETLTGHDAKSFSATTGTILSVGAMTGANSADFDVALSAGVVSITPSGDGLANGPYVLTLPCYDGAGETGNQTNVTLNIATEADTYTFKPNDSAAGEFGAIIALGDGVIGGKTIKGQAGDQYWDNTTMNGLTFTSETTITSQDTTLANRLRFAIVDETGKEMRSPQNVTFDSINVYAYYGLQSVSTPPSGITIKNTIDNLKFINCDLNGGLADIVSTFGTDLAVPSSYGFNRFITSDGTAVLAGDITIENCNIHDFGRGLNCTAAPSGGRYIIRNNDFYNFQLDCAVFADATAIVEFNRLYSPTIRVPKIIPVISVDTVANTITVAEEDFLDGMSPTMNVHASTTTPPGGLSVTTDYASTIAVSGGQAVITIVGQDITDAGSNVFMQVEPGHADYFQGIPGDDVVPNGSRFIGNVALSEEGADGEWAQAFFFEDIGGGSGTGYYNGFLFAGNIIYSANAFGIALYNSKRSVMADNTLVAPSGTAAVAVPRIRFLQHNGHDVGEMNFTYNNVSGGESSVWAGDVLTEDHVIDDPSTYGASGLFAGAGGYSPTTLAALRAAFARTDLDGSITYSVDPTDTSYAYDLPSINTATYTPFTDLTGVAQDSLQASAGVQITAITNSSGGAASNGVLVGVAGGGSPELRILDSDNSTVLTDWTSEPTVAQLNDYVYVRGTSGSGLAAVVDIGVRIGDSVDTFSITTEASDTTAPTLLSSTPAHSATAIGLLDDITLVFSEDVDLETGNITLRAGGSAVETFDVATGLGDNGGSVAKLASDSVLVTPGVPMASGVAHAVQIDATAVDDGAGNSYAGIADDVTLSFTTEAGVGVVYNDDFTSDTSSSYTGFSATVAYDAANDQLDITQTGSFGGVDVDPISINDGDTYTVRVNVSNDAGSGAIDVIWGDTAGTITANSLPSADRVNGGLTETITFTVTGTASEELHFRVRIRGDGDGTFSINWIDVIGPPLPVTSNTDANVTAIDADGWYVTYTTPPAEFDPVSDPKLVTVERLGFDATGSAVTVTEDVTIMKRVREPYPNEATLTANDASVSDFIYANDTIVENGTTVTNNSTRDYPRPIATWLHEDYRITNDGSITLRLAVAHGHARSGRPVAAVKFIASDGVNPNVEATVSSMTTVNYTASGLSAPCFETTLDISSLDDGAVTIDAIIYPWVGEEFQASVDGATAPSINFSTQVVVNNAGQARPNVYAYVDGVGATPAVSTDRATALTTGYADIFAAATAIAAYNSANHSSSELDYGVIIMSAATHGVNNASGGIAAIAETTLAPLVIEAESAANKAATILTDSENDSDQFPRKLLVRNVTLQTDGAFNFRWGNDETGATVMVFENVSFTTTADWESTFLAACGRCWMIECDGFAETSKNRALNPGSGRVKAVNLIGCDFGGGSGGGGVFNAVGCALGNATFNDDPIATGQPTREGMFYGFNRLEQSSGTTGPIRLGNIDITAPGVAIVGNVFEASGSFAGALVWVSGDASDTNVENVIIMNNTLAGNRFNVFYNDGTVSGDCSGYFKFNLAHTYNTKGDAFVQDGALIGNWPARYKTGYRANTATHGSSNSASDYGPATWIGEVGALGDVTNFDGTPIVTDYADDRSDTGTDAGGGDYTPGASYAGSVIPSGLAPHSVDQLGRAIANDGSAVAGAIQKAA